jgi:hypothetical protein
MEILGQFSPDIDMPAWDRGVRDRFEPNLILKLELGQPFDRMH